MRYINLNLRHISLIRLSVIQRSSTLPVCMHADERKLPVDADGDLFVTITARGSQIAHASGGGAAAQDPKAMVVSL